MPWSPCANKALSQRQPVVPSTDVSIMRVTLSYLLSANRPEVMASWGCWVVDGLLLVCPEGPSPMRQALSYKP